MGEAPKIVLPGDKSRIKELERKLEEYKGRLRDQDPYKHPELARKLSVGSDLGYRITILERLLEGGELDMHEFSLGLYEKEGSFNLDNFNKAATIIDDYCRTGGENVLDGTGLNSGETN